VFRAIQIRSRFNAQHNRTGMHPRPHAPRSTAQIRGRRRGLFRPIQIIACESNGPRAIFFPTTDPTVDAPAHAVVARRSHPLLHYRALLANLIDATQCRYGGDHVECQLPSMEQWRHRPTDRGDTAATTGSGEKIRQRRGIPKLEGATEPFPVAHPKPNG
jgi:hypothetical protein